MKEDNNKSIGLRLKEVRNDLKINQEDFGYILSGLDPNNKGEEKPTIDKSTVSKYENGTMEISKGAIVELISTLGISKTWLMTGRGAMKLNAGQKIQALAQETGKPHGDNKDTAGLKNYLKEDKIEKLESKWKSLLAGLMLGKQETKTMQELDDIIQDLKADNDRLEVEQNGRNNEADTK